MWFANIKKKNCKNCYACVRTCPVNAIRVKDGQAHIMKERCIVCGQCSKTCHQNIKIIKSEKQLVNRFINEGEKVIASIAPSFAAIYGESSNKIPTALRKLGFDYIEETVAGLEPVMNVYNDYANKEDGNNYITSFCPSISNLIQKHYPDIIISLIPVISPYICHSRLLKEKYGNESRVVFIGPCLAKKVEGNKESSIDAVLTFAELDMWIKEEGIKLDDLENDTFDNTCKDRRLFPIVGEATKKVKDKNPERKIFYVDGIEDCIETIEAIKNGKFNNILFEMSFCRNSCMGGSGMPRDNISYYERKENLQNYVSRENSNKKDVIERNYDKYNISIDREFKSLYVPLEIPSQEDISKILNLMGKYRKVDELDCGNCGYSTCREKALAVHNNIDEISMCVPFMREKSEKLTNTIFDTTPNLIIIVDEDLEIIDMNPSARKFFDFNPGIEKCIPIVMFLEEDKFNKVKNDKIDILKEKINIPYNNSTVIQNIIWIEESKVMLWIGDDITKDENKEKKYQKMKIDAINMTQKVINKQMIVAQEIASLLGETTAETKATLTQLKNIIKEDGARL